MFSNFIIRLENLWNDMMDAIDKKNIKTCFKPMK